jgi:F-type H+-transporting ATPase subunit b
MNFHFWTFLFETINFLALVYILKRLLYAPLHEAIDRRRQAAQQALADAERARSEAETLKQQVQVELAEVQHGREAAMHDVRNEAEALRQKLLADAARAAELKQQETDRQLEEQRRTALGGLQAQVMRLALDVARRFLHQAADKSLNRQLVARLVESLAETTAEEQQRLRAGWQASDRAELQAAEPLDDGDAEQVSAAVMRLLGAPVALDVQIKPALIGGVCLNLGGRVWDASLAGSLDESPAAADGELSHV